MHLGGRCRDGREKIVRKAQRECNQCGEAEK